MTSAALTQTLAERNLAVGTWTNQKGEVHISLTRMGRYNKNIAIPLEMVPVVIEALEAKTREVLT